MKGSFTQSMAWLHTWGGLVASWLLFAIVFAGTLSVFEFEITRWMQPETHRAQPAASREAAIQTAERYLREHAPAAGSWMIGLPGAREALLEVSWRDGRQQTQHLLDPASGVQVHPRATEGGHHFVHFHVELHGGRIGLFVVAAATLFMLAAIISGIVIHKRIFKDFFTFRPGKGQRSWLDAHNASGVLTLPFLLMIAYTGVTISVMQLVPATVQARYADNPRGPRADVVRDFSRPAARQAAPLLPLESFIAPGEALLGAGSTGGLLVRNPGDVAAQVEVIRRLDDRIAAVGDRAVFDGVSGTLLDQQTEWNSAAYFYRSLVGIHLARFGGYALYWLYFISGLAGSALIATGLLLFTEKRLKARDVTGEGRFHRFVARLNVGATAGLMLACIAYFWANRLIPAARAERETLEIALFFASWAAALLHGLLRPPRHAWREQLAATAALCLLLPLLNTLTGGLPLPQAIAEEQWTIAGVDLVALAFGFAAVCAVWMLSRERKPRTLRRRRAAAEPT